MKRSQGGKKWVQGWGRRGAAGALVAAVMGMGSAAWGAGRVGAPVLTLDPYANEHDEGAASRPADNQDLSLIPLEDLMNIEITSVAKQRQRISDAAAAVGVISQEDIRRSGMNSIVELLRMVPGVTVAQVGANQWAVGARGMNAIWNDNLLVLMDGRTIYTPLFSGVYWDTVDYILDDLERIEVIKGPGATLWGSNAVNGVINIVSKSAKDTQGVYLREYAGNDGYESDVRYGGNVDNRVYYRVYGKYKAVNDFDTAAGSSGEDDWSMPRAGFRVDAYLTEMDTLTVQGDIFQERFGNRYVFGQETAPFVKDSDARANASGANILARWTHTFSETSDLSVQMYYNRLNYPTLAVGYEQDQFDFELQHRFNLADVNEIIWGVGYRFSSDAIDTSWNDLDVATFRQDSEQTNLYNAFVQDDLTLLPKILHVIGGIKVEHNDYTGWEFQPSGQIVWTPDERNTVWGSVSRAVRTPSRFERDGSLLLGGGVRNGLPIVSQVLPNAGIPSEHLIAFEAGYRVEPMKNLAFDLAAFYNLHDGLRAYIPGEATVEMTPAPHVAIPVTQENDLRGCSYGTELSAKWRVNDAWQLAAGYSYVGVNLHSISGKSKGDTLRMVEYSTPANQFNVRSSWSITRDLELNNAFYLVDRTPETQGAGTAVPGYFRADVNVMWRPQKNVELMVGVRNLFDSGHPEFSNFSFRRATEEVPRTFFMQMDIRF